MEGFGKLKLCQPSIQGICSPIDSHASFVSVSEWYEGPILLVRKESPKFILWEQFFCLETLDLPKDLLQLRDHFDYSLEQELKEFPDVGIIFGPGWRYLLPCNDFVRNLSSSIIKFPAPIMGNALNIRGDNLAELISRHDQIKSHLAARLPIPMVWAFPIGLPVAAKDNFYDLGNKSWYIARIQGDFEGDVSLLDLHADEDGTCRVMQHDFKGMIQSANVNVKEITIHFSAVSGGFKSRRKLSRLKLVFTL